jgi:hypothetical protein
MRRLAGLSKEELLKLVQSLEDERAAGAERTEDHSYSPASIRKASVVSTSSISPGRQNAETIAINDFVMNEAADQSQDNASSRQPPRHGVSLVDMTHGEDMAVPNKSSSKEEFELHMDRDGMLLATYLESMHRRTPFCDYVDILRTLEVAAGGSTAMVPSNMQLFRLYMACAVGACVRQLNGRQPERPFQSYFTEADRIRQLLEPANLVEQVEVLLWILLYKLRSAFSSDVWYLIGLAMRKAIDADLHREFHYRNLSPSHAQLQRCLFWAVYLVERNVCWSLKKPFSLSEHDIDTKLPSSGILPVSIEVLSAADIQSQAGGPQRPLDLEIYASLIRLCRIKSRTFHHLYPQNDVLSIPDEIPLMLQEIQELDASLPPCSAPDYDFLQLHIKNATRALLEPFLRVLDSSDHLVKTCLEACGFVCRLFKRLRFERSFGFAFTMVNSVFVAGVTIW